VNYPFKNNYWLLVRTILRPLPCLRGFASTVEIKWGSLRDFSRVSSGFTQGKKSKNLRNVLKFAMQDTKICNRDEHEDELQHLSSKTLKTKQFKLF